MWLPLSELVGRLASHFRGYNQKDFRMSYEGGLPLQEYFEVLDKHFEVSLLFYCIYIKSTVIVSPTFYLLCLKAPFCFLKEIVNFPHLWE